jgi:hypothetical protein
MPPTISQCSGTAPDNNYYKLRGGISRNFATDQLNHKQICQAANILDKLYDDFTGTTTFTVTSLSRNTITNSNKPRDMLKLLPTGSGIRDLFYVIDTLQPGTDNDIIKNQMKNMIMNNDISNAVVTPVISIGTGTGTSYTNSFTGISGLISIINIMKQQINVKLLDVDASNQNRDISVNDDSAERLNYINTYYQKKQNKDTLEEISYRENEIYREKFLYIILLVTGVFIVGSQLRERYFSDISFGSSGGLFSGFGSSFGTSSSFGNMFSSNAYTLKSR